MNRKMLRFFTIIAVLAMSFAMVMPTNAQKALEVGGDVQFNVPESENGIYIVQMLDKPVVAYEGDIAGLKATKPAHGKKINPNSNAVEKYVSYLAGTHDAVVVAAIAGLWFSDVWLGVVIGVAIVINLVVAAFSGAIIPLILRRIQVDPALAGGVVLTTVTDVVGFVAFLGLATLFLL